MSLLIDFYKAIEESSAKMLAAAKAEDWDGVMRFEGACAVLIEQLRQRARSEELDAESRAEKTRIMRRILHNDAQIRYLAEPWLANFEQRVGVQNQYLH
jgi:flagellar protein FliT